MANEQNLKPFTGADDPRRHNGRPKGRKNLATIVRELENEDFDWDKLAIIADNEKLKKAIDKLKQYGSPWRAITIRALIDSLGGDKKAMEYLRKSGYGDKLDVTTKGDKIIQPLIIPDITPDDAESQTETTEGTQPNKE